MKKYFVSLLIPCLLLYLTGCYSMQEVEKDELSPIKSPKLFLRTKDKEFKFDRNDYFIAKDTIVGAGEYTYTKKDNAWTLFYGKIAVNDVKEIKEYKLDIFISILVTAVSAVCVYSLIREIGRLLPFQGPW